MSNTLEKSLLTLMAASGLAMAEGPEVSFSGYFLSQMFGEFDNEFGGNSNMFLNEIDLTTAITFNEKTSVELYTTMAGSEFWPVVAFDGAALLYNVSDDMSLTLGDHAFGTGTFNYYVYKRLYSVIDETFSRGVGLSTGGLTVMSGANDVNVWTNYLGYSFPTPEGVSASAHVAHWGQTGADKIQAGLEFGLESDAYSLNATAGFAQLTGGDPSFNVLVEPYMDFGAMNVLASVYAEIDDNAATVAGGELPDLHVYVEPGFPINDVTSFGVTVEYHDQDLDSEEGVDDTSIQTWPTLYFTPADDLAFLATIGTGKTLADGEELWYGYGVELQGSF